MFPGHTFNWGDHARLRCCLLQTPHLNTKRRAELSGSTLVIASCYGSTFLCTKIYVHVVQRKVFKNHFWFRMNQASLHKYLRGTNQQYQHTSKHLAAASIPIKLIKTTIMAPLQLRAEWRLQQPLDGQSGHTALVICVSPRHAAPYKPSYKQAKYLCCCKVS